MTYLLSVQVDFSVNDKLAGSGNARSKVASKHNEIQTSLQFSKGKDCYGRMLAVFPRGEHVTNSRKFWIEDSLELFFGHFVTVVCSRLSLCNPLLLEKSFGCKIGCLLSWSDIVQIIFVPAHAEELTGEWKRWLCSHYGKRCVCCVQGIKPKVDFKVNTFNFLLMFFSIVWLRIPKFFVQTGVLPGHKDFSYSPQIFSILCWQAASKHYMYRHGKLWFQEDINVYW